MDLPNYNGGWFTVEISYCPTEMDETGCEGIYIKSCRIRWWHPLTWVSVLASYPSNGRLRLPKWLSRKGHPFGFCKPGAGERCLICHAYNSGEEDGGA